MSDAADHARRRARHLRSIAVRIEQSPVMWLEQFAGDDTWAGRRPLLCRATLQANLAQLHRSADELRWQAYVFEQRAVQLDAIAAVANF